MVVGNPCYSPNVKAKAQTSTRKYTPLFGGESADGEGIRVAFRWRLLESPAMPNLPAVLKQLQQERTRLASQLGRLNSAISALTGVGYDGARLKRRTISAAGRAKIAAAQRLRWAKAKGSKVVSIARGKKRKLSAAALARIRAAQKARWAKWRKQQKRA